MFNHKIKIEIKTTTTNHKIKIEIKTTIQQIVLKSEFKYSPMSEANTCIAEPNLEILPLK